MNRLIKTLAIFMLITIILLSTTTVAFADKYVEDCGTFEIHMHDNADLMSDSEEEDLIDEIESYFTGMHYNVLILTIDDADGKSTTTYADDYMDDLFPTDNNIGFVIDMDNREVHINTMGKAIKCLTDSMLDSAIDSGYDYLVSEDYDSCFDEMAYYCSIRMSDNPSDVGYDPSLSSGGSTAFGDAFVGGLIPSAVVTAIAVVILILNHNKANKAQNATAYVSGENYNVIDKDEIFTRSYETVIHDYYKPKQSSSGGSHGGGSSHRSSSGRSHGGSSRKF